MSQHNKGERCTGLPSCMCSKHCLCRSCIFDRRSRTMYDGLRGRLAAKKWKSGARAGTIRKEKIDIPYTLDQFRAWLRVVLEDTPHCEYCHTPIDILTISPDHQIPVSRGGSLELANLRGTDMKCNQRKGRLTGKEFMFLVKCVATMPEAARSDIWKRMGGGIKFMGGKKPIPPTFPSIPNDMQYPDGRWKKSDRVIRPRNILAIPAPKSDELF